jgi:Icc-related predicted phosphoesterase
MQSSAPDPLATPARIAFAGDWHANTRWAVTAVNHAAECGADVIVHLGDFGYEFRAAFVGGLDRALARTGLRLLFVDGNHEDFPTLLRHPVRPNGLRQLTDRIWHLPRGFRWNWGGVQWLALGGAHSVDRPWREPGSSWWREETITEEQARSAAAGGQADIMVSHDCPSGVDIPGLAESSHLWPAEELVAADLHRDRLRTVVDSVRPRSIWHGHFHRRYDTSADLGYGPVQVTGLDCDGSTLDGNISVVALADIPRSPSSVSWNSVTEEQPGLRPRAVGRS